MGGAGAVAPVVEQRREFLLEIFRNARIQGDQGGEGGVGGGRPGGALGLGHVVRDLRRPRAARAGQLEAEAFRFVVAGERRQRAREVGRQQRAGIGADEVAGLREGVGGQLVEVVQQQVEQLAVGGRGAAGIDGRRGHGAGALAADQRPRGEPAAPVGRRAGGALQRGQGVEAACADAGMVGQGLDEHGPAWVGGAGSVFFEPGEFFVLADPGDVGQVEQPGDGHGVADGGGEAQGAGAVEAAQARQLRGGVEAAVHVETVGHAVDVADVHVDGRAHEGLHEDVEALAEIAGAVAVGGEPFVDVAARETAVFVHDLQQRGDAAVGRALGMLQDGGVAAEGADFEPRVAAHDGLRAVQIFDGLVRIGIGGIQMRLGQVEQHVAEADGIVSGPRFVEGEQEPRAGFLRRRERQVAAQTGVDMEEDVHAVHADFKQVVGGMPVQKLLPAGGVAASGGFGFRGVLEGAVDGILDFDAERPGRRRTGRILRREEGGGRRGGFRRPPVRSGRRRGFDG